MRSEAEGRADFSGIRYAQCWEDADVLLSALEPGPGKHCLSIASAGDNTLALLSRDPESVLALDLSPAQLACLELRVAAYRVLQHGELLALIGCVDSDVRPGLYAACRKHLSSGARAFWDDRPRLIAAGIGSVGRFEHYFRLFRERVLPLVHSRDTVGELLRPKSGDERRSFYRDRWNNRRWRRVNEDLHLRHHAAGWRAIAGLQHDCSREDAYGPQAGGPGRRHPGGGFPDRFGR